MEFEDQEEEQEGELELGPSYNDLTRPVQIKMPTPVDVAPPPPPPPPPLRKTRYRECQKNHAVGIGAHAVDGCGEFIAAGEDGTLESLKCAACNCHRNFHRKESEHGGAFAFHQPPQQHLILPPHHQQGHFGYRTPGGYLYHHHVGPAAPQQRVALLALPSSSGGGGSGEDLEDNYYSNPSSSGKKRFRTKFSQEQKDKMLSFAERLGWRIQKQDEEIVQGFCNELGIKRHVLKVWMHNNKHTLGGGKKTTPT